MSEQLSGCPSVVDELGFLSLHLDGGNFQSLMRKSRPHRLELGYTRTMMSFLLFKPQPRHVVMIGLGGGSIAKHCYRHLHQSRVTVVEINPDVIALREQFYIPDDNARFSIMCKDGAEFVARHPEMDVLMVDGFDQQGQVPQLCTQQFYDDCFSALSSDGVLVVNILGADTRFDVYLARIRQSFADRVKVLRSEDCENRIVIAIKGESGDLSERELMSRAAQLEIRHSLKFRHMAGQIVQMA